MDAALLIRRIHTHVPALATSSQIKLNSFFTSIAYACIFLSVKHENEIVVTHEGYKMAERLQQGKVTADDIWLVGQG